MNVEQKLREKEKFKAGMGAYLKQLKEELTVADGNWKVRGFIDISKNIYSLASDTKVISKLFEINIFPYLRFFAENNNYNLELAKYQNYYPDSTFISKNNNEIKIALDIKTTFRKNENLCNGFTLGSHGEYFVDRNSTKNIQYPYSSYIGHFCLGLIYNRSLVEIDETKIYNIRQLRSIPFVASDFTFFISEKWKIASDKSGSGNTANIGSIKNIDKILSEQCIFSAYSEELFDLYWINYGKLSFIDDNGKSKPITSLQEFLKLNLYSK